MKHVSPESVTCGVTVANFGVLGFLWNDCTRKFGLSQERGLSPTLQCTARLRPLHGRVYSVCFGSQHMNGTQPDSLERWSVQVEPNNAKSVLCTRGNQFARFHSTYLCAAAVAELAVRVRTRQPSPGSDVGVRLLPPASLRLFKTVSSGSFGFQGPGSRLIGSVQEFWLSIGGCDGRQWGWKT